MSLLKYFSSTALLSPFFQTQESTNQARAIVANASTLFESIANRPDAREAFTKLAHAAAQPASTDRVERMLNVVKALGLATDPHALNGIRGSLIRSGPTARRAEDSITALFAYEREQLDKNNAQVTGVAITGRGAEGAPEVMHFSVALEGKKNQSLTRAVAHFLAGGLR